MATTTNFGWETPDDTDLVKDGAAAMRTLGNAIDTSFVDLKGGTTNQVLAKNSNTDLDFKWVADATGIPATIIDAKGDLIAGTAADTAGRLAVGTNGHVLTADSTTGTGLKWAAVATTKSFSLLNSGGTTLTGATTITYSGISNQDELLIIIGDASSANASSNIQFRFNTDTTAANYQQAYGEIQPQATYGASMFNSQFDNGAIGYFDFSRLSGSAGSLISGYIRVSGCATSGTKVLTWMGSGRADGSNTQKLIIGGGTYAGASTISSFSLISTSGNFDSGSFFVYGAS